MKPYNLESPIEVKEMSVGEFALHGDVIIERVKSLPIDFAKMNVQKDDCLALGEATGHHHKLFRIPDREGADLPHFDLRYNNDGIKFLKVNAPVQLRHQEHREITLPPGDYRIGIQREYDPLTKRARQVAD